MATPADKVEAARMFLVQAPLGEFNEVRKAVSKLLDNDALFKQACELLPAHFESLCAPIATGKEPSYVLVSESTRLDHGVYACTRSGNAYTIDYSKKKETGSRELSDGEKEKIGLEDELRILMEKAVSNYITEHHDKYGKYSVTKTGDSYHINIHSDRSRPKHFWSGTWVAKGQLVPSGDEYNLSLETIVSVHYYEDGNVQMSSTNKEVVKIEMGEAERVAEDTVGALNKFLIDYHSAVSDHMVNMQESTFKQLRRQLPITKTKIEWDKLQAYTLVMESV